MKAWAFHYAGPRDAKVDHRCVTCLSKLQQQCPTHQQGNDKSCAHCKAVHGGECQAHWGLAAAFEYYRANIIDHQTDGDQAAKEDFDRACAIAVATLPHPKLPNISVTMRGESEPGLRNFHVEFRSI